MTFWTPEDFPPVAPPRSRREQDVPGERAPVAPGTAATSSAPGRGAPSLFPGGEGASICLPGSARSRPWPDRTQEDPANWEPAEDPASGGNAASPLAGQERRLKGKDSAEKRTGRHRRQTPRTTQVTGIRWRLR